MIVNPNSAASSSDNKSAVPNNQTNKNSDFSKILNSAVSNKKSTSLDCIFQEASEKYNVPVNLLKAVAKAESNFKATAKSSCGAMGIMQLMPSTAKSLGVTNPYNAEQNIMGGAKFLGQLLKRFDGNTKLAVAAYNAGPGNVIKYSGIPPFKETQNYVIKVMGYMGKSLDAGTITEKTVPKAVTFSQEKPLQSSETPINMFENEELSGKEYAQLMNIYQYQLQISLLSDTDTNIPENTKILG